MEIQEALEPNVKSTLAETKRYLEHLLAEGRPIEVRKLIGFWGFKGRGKNSIHLINSELVKMALRTEPPFDSGSLDSLVSIQKLSGEESVAAAAEQPDDHLLTLSRIGSASFALPRTSDAEPPVGYVLRETSIADALTIMLRHDYSQLPVIESKSRREVSGVFTWQSYAQARLRGEDPKVVGDAVVAPVTVDLHSDLFASVGPITEQGYVLVTYRGLLSGIVTASDLTREFENLTLPFLTIGRCEQELRRIARVKFEAALKHSGTSVDEITFGRLQQFFKKNWDSLGWSLSRDEFFGWLDATRKLRNSIAHFDNQDKDTRADLETVHRLTRWLRSVPASVDSMAYPSESDEDTALLTSKSPAA